VPEAGEMSAPPAGTAPPDIPAGTPMILNDSGGNSLPPRPATPRQEQAARAQLTRERIVGAAVDLLEREGEEELSMRRLAAELGYGVMSLYNHVPNKAALLDAIAEHVMADLQFAPDPQADWRDQARALVRAFRGISRRYPRSVNVVIMRQLSSPAGLRPLERALATARAAGFDGVTAVRVMRAFVAYALGTVVNDARLDQIRGAAVEDRDAYVAGLDPAEFPNVLALAGPLLMERDHEADFEFGLDLLIGAVGALRGSALPVEDGSTAR
jgi:AcrR family transcriptional regulator